MPRIKNPAAQPPKKRAPRKAAATQKASPSYTSFVDPEKRGALIAEAAYFRAEKRGFAPGHEAADWHAAEAEVDARLLRGANGSSRT